MPFECLERVTAFNELKEKEGALFPHRISRDGTETCSYQITEASNLLRVRPGSVEAAFCFQIFIKQKISCKCVTVKVITNSSTV